MEKPAFVSLQVLNSCNLHCIQCDYHLEKKAPDQLTTLEQLDIIKQIATWSSDIRLKFTGGEPFLDKNRLFRLLDSAHNYNLVTFILTNGTLINEEDIEHLFNSELGCISVSLDSHIPELHDNMRGSSGCFESVSRFLQQFCLRRKLRNASTKLWASTILTNNNLNNIDELIFKYEDLGFDAIKFQPLFPNYRRKYSSDWKHKSSLFPTEYEIKHGFERILYLKETHPILNQSDDYILKMQEYFLMGEINPCIRCNIMNQVMIVDYAGNVRFCFNQDPNEGLCTVMPSRDMNIKQYDLKTLWNTTHTFRQEMQLKCHYSCGLLWDTVRNIEREKDDQRTSS